MPSDGKFEKLQHTTYSGQEHEVPLLVKFREGLDDESVGLLKVADIIGREGVDVSTNVLALISEVARVQNGTYQQPVMVADPDGSASFIIRPLNTEINRFNKDSIELPTELLAEFLNMWADYNTRD